MNVICLWIGAFLLVGLFLALFIRARICKRNLRNDSIAGDDGESAVWQIGRRRSITESYGDLGKISRSSKLRKFAVVVAATTAGSLLTRAAGITVDTNTKNPNGITIKNNQTIVKPDFHLDLGGPPHNDQPHNDTPAHNDTGPGHVDQHMDTGINEYDHADIHSDTPGSGPHVDYPHYDGHIDIG